MPEFIARVRITKSVKVVETTPQAAVRDVLERFRAGADPDQQAVFEIESVAVHAARPPAAPTRWGMFSAAGNRALTSLARAYRAAVIRDGSEKSHRVAALTFLRGWQSVVGTPGTGEASDTAVRETVAEYVENVSGYRVLQRSRAALGRKGPRL